MTDDSIQITIETPSSKGGSQEFTNIRRSLNLHLMSLRRIAELRKERQLKLLRSSRGIVETIPIEFMIGEISMYILTAEQAFDAAHFLKGHAGACSNIHGHRWRVVARVSCDMLQEAGSSRAMVMDFSDFRNILKELTDRFDHTLIYEKGSLKDTTVHVLRDEGFTLTEIPFRPTSECFSRYFYEKLQARHLPVHEVTVFETPGSSCTFRED